jgi:hypothetical protein
MTLVLITGSAAGNYCLLIIHFVVAVMQVRARLYSFHILGNARRGDILSRARRCKVKVAKPLLY